MAGRAHRRSGLAYALIFGLCSQAGMAQEPARALPRPVAPVPVPAPAPAAEASRPASEAVAPEPVSSNPLAERVADRICRAGLRMLGATFEEIAPIRAEAGENPACGVARPLRILEAGPGLVIEGGAVMGCPSALSLALWARDEAQPAARMMPGAPRITALLPGSTYQCRHRIGDSGLSEHGRGTAFDLMGMRFSDGRELMIAPREGSGGVDEGFQKAIRHGACLYFTTVLGPGSNASHDDHLHFDALARRNGWRICE